MVGDSAVGKSSILSRWSHSTFLLLSSHRSFVPILLSDEFAKDLKATISVESHVKMFKIKRDVIKAQLWVRRTELTDALSISFSIYVSNNSFGWIFVHCDLFLSLTVRILLARRSSDPSRRSTIAARRAFSLYSTSPNAPHSNQSISMRRLPISCCDLFLLSIFVVCSQTQVVE